LSQKIEEEGYNKDFSIYHTCYFARLSELCTTVSFLK